MAPTTLSAAQARRIALAAQGFADKRPSGRIDRRHLRKVFDRINVIQVDSVNVLVRSQELPLFARLGPHPRTMLAAAIDDGELWEYWAHVAAIVPSSQHRLFRWKMERGHPWRAIDRIAAEKPGFVDDVLAAHPRRAGRSPPATSSSAVGKKGSWWSWDDGKLVLEHLFHCGQVVAVRRPPRLRPPLRPARAGAAGERPRRADADRGRGPQGAARHRRDQHGRGDARGPLRLPPPGPAARRRPARRGIRPLKPLVAELVEEGVLQPVQVEGWAKPAYLHRDAVLPRAVDARALLSPFDSLVWYRQRTERLFDFFYRIEIYVPAPKRIYGYYVLPYLLGDRLVGRVDLKADRAAGVLRVQGAYVEAGVDDAAVTEPLMEELRLMAGWLGLDTVATTDRGELAASLRRAGVAAVEPELSP